MTIQEMKDTSFDSPSLEKWRETAEASLKGKPLAALETETPEGITLKPLYTTDDLTAGTEERISAIRQGMKGTDWTILQETYSEDPAAFLERTKESISRGNGAVVYTGGWTTEGDKPVLKELAGLITEWPVYVRCAPDDPFLGVFGAVDEGRRDLVTGFADVERSADLSRLFPALRTIGISTVDEQMQGADAVTELAVAFSKAAGIAAGEDDFTAMADRLFFSFAVDTHFFTEVAKLRAFRLMFRSFASAYGVEEPAVPVIACTSLRTFTLADPYVNLLRSANEAFSAAVGGADAISVAPFDRLTGGSVFSERVARNVQHILKEEVHADRVLDPAGGSYYIETLTEALYRKAWALFIEFEEKGGYEAISADGTLTDLLSGLQEQRVRRLALRKDSLIGTNQYADPDEPIHAAAAGSSADGRLAVPFEELRLSLQGKTVHLLQFGSLKDVKPVSDFTAGVLAVGGIRPELSPLFDNTEEALHYVRENAVGYAVVCAPAAQAETVVAGLLRDKPERLRLDAAGRFEDEAALLEAGLSGFYRRGQDILAKLEELKGILEGGTQHEQA
ncbi:methylmalonyl-CoA mutase family protein [Bhargavaea ullalensis]|uniref:Methylmalonyl-CoA mutase n=1 Tax=Bhargavaea ullalensis TaxID=1265685 RepID=A0ABV2G967_9BACL